MTLPQSKLIERLNATDIDEESSSQLLLPINTDMRSFQQTTISHNYFRDASWYLECISASIIAFLINLLDIISYGRIVFPLIPSIIGRASTVSPNTMVMYTLTTVVSQLCFTTFSSMDHGLLAGMMIEVIPFYHAYFWTIYYSLTLEEPFITDFSSLYPTLFFMVLFSSGTLAFVFYILGTSNLSKLIQYFPKQVIYGCMGAIGYFLFITGIDFVVSGMETKTPNIHLFTGIPIKILSLSNKIGLIVSSTPAMVILGIALFAAILAALLQRHKITSSNPFIIPSICMLLVAGFYLALLFSGTSIGDARDAGWILESPNEEAHTKEGFWHLFSFYKYFFQFSKIDWSIIPKLFPTFLGMVTFALINVPINVPAFAAATSQKPLLQTELKLHGFSNVAGFLGGGLANYFTFSNSLLFFQSGGNLSRKSGYLVAFFTFLGLFFIYYDFFNFLPKFVPVFLVFYLTIELFWEAFIKSYYYLYDKRELCTIVIIVAIASTVGFSEGLFVGLGVAFLDTVLKLASVPISDMAYPPMSISRDVHQIKIGGFLFFGNMDQMVEIFRQLIPLLESNESTTLILDFRGLIGWDLTYQLEFKSMTDQYRTLFSHPSISWLMIGSPRHCAFLKRAGWIQSSREEILVSGHEESSENIDDTIRFQYIAALVDLDMALLNHEEISGKNTNRNIFDK